jgi:hypothetical protein
VCVGAEEARAAPQVLTTTAIVSFVSNQAANMAAQVSSAGLFLQFSDFMSCPASHCPATVCRSLCSSPSAVSPVLPQHDDSRARARGRGCALDEPEQV